MSILLLHPPLDDPTLPYHSTAYLKGHLAVNGFTDVSLRDINVEFVNYLFEEATIRTLQENAERSAQTLGRKPYLSFEEQEAYHALVTADYVDPHTLAEAVSNFRKLDTFLDFTTYKKSLNLVSGHLGLAGALSYPAEWAGFQQRTRGRLSIYSFTDLFNVELMERITTTFSQFFDARLRHEQAFQSATLFGISIVYDHQLTHALHLARLLKRAWPDKQIVLGGTSLSQIYKHLKDKTLMRKFFTLCDAIVVGEGETAICEIAGSDKPLLGKRFTNTITYDPLQDEVILPAIHYENVNELGTPLYEHPWDLYLSPARGINYAPTRGCYWNRCTFCDYGLNTDRPTSPWRERASSRVVDDLEKVRHQQNVRYVYFAVDVMAPGYLERLSDSILERSLDIRWSAELRMEKIFTAERCRKMASSGCVCVSFGMESGTQRVLDLIDKGTKVEYMAETMKNFSSAGIACQLMAFTDFPTETAEEKAGTFNFIESNDENWATGGMGSFLLTGTSIIAKNPERFGITTVETKDADVGRAISYIVNDKATRNSGLAEDADASFDESGGIFPAVLGRPWAGGTDTLHSMLYYEKYGRRFFKDHPLDRETHNPIQFPGNVSLSDRAIAVHARLVTSQIDFKQLIENRKEFFRYLTRRLEVPAEATYSSFSEWHHSVSPLRTTHNDPTYWMLLGTKCVRLDRVVFRLLKAAIDRRPTVTLEQVLELLPAGSRLRYQTFFEELAAQGFISLVHPGELVHKKLLRVDQHVISRDRKAELQPPGRLVEAPSLVQIQI